MSEADLVRRIRELKEERRAVLLVHNYQRGEIQDLGDFVGDSLGLSRAAAQTDAERIVFCGVHFMAETAALLAPGRPVLLPDPNAGCAMAEMATPRELAQLKAAHPGAYVITYVNSTAAIKAMSDICCTSANAVEIVRQAPEGRPLLFVPDRNLGHYCQTQTGRSLVLWNGYCPTHERILPEHVADARARHPGALLVVHPECRPAVVAVADHVASTTGILSFCRERPETEFLIGTEVGLLHRLRRESPRKRFFPASEVSDCPQMKLVTLEKLLWCLEELSGEVTVPREVAAAARRPIERMLEATGA